MSIIALDRTCYELDNEGKRTSSDSVPVTDLLAMPAWVLLGEPGMGKTTTLKQLGGNDVRGYVRARDLSVKTAQDFHDLPIILVDGLDEFGDNLSVRNKLAQLARDGQFSSIGISSRYADWFQKRDRPDFKAVHQGIRVFVLDPLSEPQTLVLAAHFLQETQSTQDAKAFTEQAQHLGLGAMLANPQLMVMLVKAIVNNKGDAWPQSRSEVYELACKQMLSEHNDIHKLALGKALDLVGDLYAAGELAAIYLLSQSGAICTLEYERSNANTKVELPNLPNTQDRKTQWERLLKHSKLFVKTIEHTFEPIHRTVAEYLAARYLAERLKNGLSVDRLCAWLLAQDGGIVKNLRGLAGWMAALTNDRIGRQRMIEADPRAILNYGDLSLLDRDGKVLLLKSLEKAPERGYASNEEAATYAPLVTEELLDVVRAYLATHQKTKAASDMVYLLTVALANTGQPLPLEKELEAIVRDENWEHYARRQALRALIQNSKATLETLLPLAEAIRDKQISDQDGGLLGELLLELYPKWISPSAIFSYYGFHKDGYYSAYDGFWSRICEGIDKQSKETLGNLTNGFVAWVAKQNYNVSAAHLSYRLDHMKALLVETITQCGHLVSPAQLVVWFESCWDGMSHLHIRESALRERVTTWAKQHPEVVQAMLQRWFEKTEERYQSLIFKFQDLLPTTNIQTWFLQLADSCNQKRLLDKAGFCISQAVMKFDAPSNGAPLQIEALHVWIKKRPQLEPYLEKALTCEWKVDDWKEQEKEWKAEAAKRKLKQQQIVEAKFEYITTHLEGIRTGEQVAVLDECSSYFKLWLLEKLPEDWAIHHPLFSAIQSNEAVHAAFLQGYATCLSRITAETPLEARAALKTRPTLWLQRPALFASALLFSRNPAALNILPETQLKGLLTFHFLSTQLDPEWVQSLLKSHPSLVAAQWLDIALEDIKNKADWIHHLAEFARNNEYEAAAKIALPILLRRFPVKILDKQMSDFGTLLLGCWRHMPSRDLIEILELRLARKAITPLQRAHCLMVGFLLDPTKFESLITGLLEVRQIQIHDLMAFLNKAGFPHRSQVDFANLTPAAIAFCIRLFAPHCEPREASGASFVGPVEVTRDFVNLLINHLSSDASPEATSALRSLVTEIAPAKWLASFEPALNHQIELAREAHFKPATAVQIANALISTNPANHQDLITITMDTFAQLQCEINGSELKLSDLFWNMSGKQFTTHRNEDQCRNVIAEFLRERLRVNHILVSVEVLQSDAKRSDMRISYQQSMSIPIEVKGDWHEELWTAPEAQLATLYMNHPDCNRLGIYLVLWTGEIEKMKPAFRKAFPNGTLPSNLDTFKQQMTNHIKVNEACKGVKLFVLDISR